MLDIKRDSLYIFGPENNTKKVHIDDIQYWTIKAWKNMLIEFANKKEKKRINVNHMSTSASV